MDVSIRAQGFTVTRAMDEVVRAQVTQKLAKFAPSIVNVDVYVRDTNGPKGGDDKTARCVVHLREGLTVTVETIHSDLYTAIRATSRRAARAVRRTLGKHRRFERDATLVAAIRAGRRRLINDRGGVGEAVW